MLHELHIERLGVIENLDLVLEPGLTVVTGETGAGKTMVVEAISLLVGGRADPSMVRAGCDEARVEGRFVDGDDEVVLTRVVPSEGRSRAYVDGRLATVGTLAELGSRLVDMHGQHAHQRLLSVASQREALDRFAGTDLGPLRDARSRLAEIDRSLAALGGDERTRARELDLLRFQVAELDASGLNDPAEDEQLDALETTLAGAAGHRQAAAAARTALDGDDGSARDLVAGAAALVGSGPPFETVSARLASLVVELADVSSELRALAESIDDDPERLDEIRRRRQLLRDLRRKYGDTLADVIAYRDEAAARLTELEGFDAAVARLEADRAVAARAEECAAAAVGATRRGAAGELAAAVGEVLRTLAMPKARFEVWVGDDEPGDEVTFMFTANPGSSLQPLAKVASGGELARTMLALRMVLTEAPDTLVFDEVDAGVGGAAATAVGRALASLGASHQVFVVTHLAQVASLASTQIAVDKQVEGRTTTAVAAVVRGDARVGEIARMLSGQPDSRSAREHAAELLGTRTEAPSRRRATRGDH